MAIFNLETTDNRAVRVEYIYNFFGSNTWAVLGGDTAILPATVGTWNASAAGNRLIMYDTSSQQIAYLTIDIAFSFSDPFSNVHVGDTGDALVLVPQSRFILWRLLSK